MLQQRFFLSDCFDTLQILHNKETTKRVDPGTKINGAYNRDVLFQKKLLPVIRCVSGKNFIFQHAPAHRARETLQLLHRETPDFISPDLWMALNGL